jgi:hypothetical protein
MQAQLLLSQARAVALPVAEKMMRREHADIIKTCTDAGVDLSRIRKTYLCIKLEKDGKLNSVKDCKTFCESGLDESSEQPNDAQKAFWKAFKCHHTDDGTVKFHNSNMTLWGDNSDLAVVETAKLFCSTLGQNAGQKQNLMTLTPRRFST